MPLTVHVPPGEFYDHAIDQFVYSRDVTIHIEHSLAAIAKWEARWHKPFLTNKAMTGEEFLDYIRCMTLEDEDTIDPNIYMALSRSNFESIQKYIENTMTATWFKDEKKGRNGGAVITAEIIYYYMVELGIPFECENWHVNRLMTLIRVCSEKQAVPKKMARKDIFAQNAALNAQRKARLGTKG